MIEPVQIGCQPSSAADAARRSRRRSRRRAASSTHAQPARREQAVEAARRRARAAGALPAPRASWKPIDRVAHFDASREVLDERVELRLAAGALKVWASRPSGSRARRRRPGSTIDSRMNCFERLARPLRDVGAAYRGPARPFPLAPAGLKRVAAVAAVGDEERLPGRPLPPAPAGPPPVWLFVQDDELVAGSSTIASERISACPRPQSSVQITGKVPSRVRRDHELRQQAGHGVLLLAELRHPERVDHVERLQLQLRRSCGSAGAGSRRSRCRRSGYLNSQRELLRDDADDQRLQRIGALRLAQAVDGRFLGGPGAGGRGRVGSCSFFASTTALTIEIAVTSAAGTAVQTISRPVLPCIGGPSSSSSGRARKLKIAVDDHRRDEREDRDADRGHEPEDEVDPVGLLARRVGQPRDQQRHRRGARAEQDSQDDQLDDRSPAHRGRDYWTRRRAVREATRRSRSLRNSCN